jgi:light-regulated signal transduction histidine kinase (bacteriophytochrome)
VATHDLQQPLVTVNWSLKRAASYLRDCGLFSGNIKESILHAEATVSRMTGLVARLLTYTSLQADGLRVEDVDIGALVEYVIMDLAALTEKTGAVITAEELPTVRADRYLIGEVLQNLIENGIKYAHPDRAPEVHVSVVHEPTAYRICVSDNGCGVDMSHAGEIFAPRVRVSSAEDISGAGLGLATCRKIVNLHGGTIGVTPRDGGGSTFWFALPRG